MRSIKYTNARLFTLLFVVIMVLSVCGNIKGQEAPVNNAASLAVSAGQPDDTTAFINADGFTVSYEFTEDDTDDNWNANSATTVAFNGNTARISGSGAAFSGGTLTIRETGTYVLSGTLVNGQVLINAARNDVVRLVMNNVSLRNETGPAIYAQRAGKVVLILESGSVNTVSDGLSNSASRNSDEQSAAIFVQNNLSITGSGTLTVNGNYRHGVRAQDILAITGGVITVNAAGDALRGRDGVAVRDGVLTLTAGGDGIQANNANSDDMGFVIINGGAFNIKAKNDGIQAESSLTVTGGVFQITSGGGSAGVPVRANSRGWGGWTAPVTSESDSMKALKAGKRIFITNGDFTIDSEDDGVHSNGNVLITGGRLFIKTGDDGIHADAVVEITGGNIDIPACYEGIEGLSIIIGGGNISVTASDDAVNAADGSAGQGGWPMGRRGFAVNENMFVRITDGTIDLYAAHDGIDSNGNVFIEGGAVRISGPSRGMEGAIDLDGAMYVSGGEFITAGSVINISSSSTQPVILVSYTRLQASGSVIAIKDAAGNTLLEYTSRNTYSMSGFTSPAFKTGNTYALFIDNQKKVDIRISSMITSIGDDGRSYSGGAGSRGNMPPGGGVVPGRR